MSFQELLEVVSEIYAEKQRVKALQPGGVVDVPPIKVGSGKDRLIYPVTIEKPAS